MQFKARHALYFLLCFITVFVYFIFFHRVPKESKLMDDKLAEHVLCLLVPFRNVYEELFEFVPYMNEFLNRQSIRFHFVVVNHAPDGHRFNKGVVFNAGFKIITKEYPDCDYIALHDVDLLPLNDELSYAYPGDNVYHLIHPDLHPHGMKYDPERYVGGIALISNEQFNRTNGFGNGFWGWGGEDRNFFYRMRNKNITRVRPSDLTTDRSNTFRSIHSDNRIRDRQKCYNTKKYELVENDFESGLHDVSYELISVRAITIDDISLSFYSITVPCDYPKIFWCISSC